MKKEEKEKLKKYRPLLLKIAIVLGAIISVLTLTGTHETLRKWLSGFFIIILGILVALSQGESDFNSETVPENDFNFGEIVRVIDGDTIEINSEIIPETGSNLVEVVRVIDGDTIEINNKIIVRLLGIDAPEQGNCYYNEAKEALNELVLGEDVRLEKDIFGTDNFGRLLRYVFVPKGDFINDVFVNDYLLEQGFADTLFISKSQKYRDILIHSRNEAVTNKKGIWSACEQELEEKISTFETNDPPPNPDCVIKGNISEHGYGKTYFFLGCPNYNTVKVDLEKGDRYFCTNEEAEAAGFKMAEGCKY